MRRCLLSFSSSPYLLISSFHYRQRLDATQRERLDRAIHICHTAVDLLGLEETFRLQVVHQPVGVVGRRVTGGALALAEEDFLSMHLRSCCLFGIELAVEIKFRGRRE